MNKELVLKNKYKVIYMPKTKAKAFENIKNGDVIEITLPLTHKRSGDNNSLIAYYPIINGNEIVGIPTIKKLIEKGMILEEIEQGSTDNIELQQENKKLNGAIQTYDILLKTSTEENKQLQKDIKNIIKILDKNCDDLEATEEEFDSLDRWQRLQVVELEQGSDKNE